MLQSVIFHHHYCVFSLWFITKFAAFLWLRFYMDWFLIFYPLFHYYIDYFDYDIIIFPILSIVVAVYHYTYYHKLIRIFCIWFKHILKVFITFHFYYLPPGMAIKLVPIGYLQKLPMIGRVIIHLMGMDMGTDNYSQILIGMDAGIDILVPAPPRPAHTYIY